MQYVCTGAQGAPTEALVLAKELAHQLAGAGYLVRSGSGSEFEAAMETGALAAGGRVEVYLPWRGYNGNKSSLYGATDTSLQIAARHNPAWAKLNTEARWQHGRTVHQVLGTNLSAPADFLICWTPDGMESKRHRTPRSGVAATAIAVAEASRIPVFNIEKGAGLIRLKAYLKQAGIKFSRATPLELVAQGNLF